MDKAKILRLCNQIEMIIVTVCNTGYTLQPGDEDAIFNRTKAIIDEVSAPPKSNADRIRQMTDEELADFFCKISQCCGNDACMLCPIFEGCAQNVMCVERWLKQEVKTDDER